MIARVRLFVLAALGLILGAPSLSAQAPITALGLGYKVEPLDGRSAALGGTGLGLLGGSFSIRNPADLLQHQVPGFGISFAGEGVTISSGPLGVDTGRQRFTTIRAIVPFSGWATSIAFGSEFDQDWQARITDTLFVSDGFIPFEETREHDGGISTIDLSLARQFGPLAVGASVQRLTGSLRQTFFRSFDTPGGSAPSLGSVGGGQELAYSAWRVKGGATLTVADRYVLSGSFSLPNTLTATVQDSAGAKVGFDLPSMLELGGSARLTNSLLFAAAFGTGGWSDVGNTATYTSHDVMWFGGGFELDGLRFLGGDLPLRVGARTAELPFSTGPDPIRETAITGGFGWEFQNGLAVVDLALAVGSRGDFAVDGIEETFSRFTLSFTLRQLGRR